MHLRQILKGRDRFFSYAPVVIWIGVIFVLSGNTGSMSETSRFIRPLLEFLFPTALPETLTIYHGYIRKFAHFAEYAVLGLLVCRAIAVTGIRSVVLAVLLISAVALTDEGRQSLNSQRTGSLWDVLIDLSGGIFAVLFYKIAKWK